MGPQFNLNEQMKLEASEAHIIPPCQKAPALLIWQSRLPQDQCRERFRLASFFPESFWLGCSAQQIRGAPRRPSNEVFYLNYPVLLLLLTMKKITYPFCVY